MPDYMSVGSGPATMDRFSGSGSGGAPQGMDPWGDRRRYREEADRLAGQEDSRNKQALDFLMGEFGRNTGDVASDRDVGRMYAGASDQAARGAMAAQRNSRLMFGQSGTTGGGILGNAGGMLELQRLGQLSEAKNKGKMWQMEQNAAQRMRRMQAGFGVSEQMSKAPSALRLDAMGDLMGFDLTMEGIKAQAQASREAADASKQNGMLGFAGGIFSGLLGML